MNINTRTFLEGLTGFNVVFMKTQKDTKRTIRSWRVYEEYHDQHAESRIDLAYQWLQSGFGVCYLLRNRLAAVDADAPETVQRVMDFEERDGYIHLPKVDTPSGGIHGLFQHPADLSLRNMKNHVCHPFEEGVKVPWDFKLGERTMLMAPGTVMSKGVYKAGIWLQPPVLDVRFLAPTIEIYRQVPEFIKDTRPWVDRVMAAMTYLRCRAPVSIKGKGRRNVLHTVADHIVGYYDLDPGLAFHLMVNTKKGKDRKGNPVTYIAWNERCLDDLGTPSPWSDDDLWHALDAAVDNAPGYGIKMYKKAQEKTLGRNGAATFIEMLTYLPEPRCNIWITADELYSFFIEYTGVKPSTFQKCELGLEMTRAIDQGRLPFVHAGRTAAFRFYAGLDQNTLRVAIAAYEERQKMLCSVG